MSISLFVNPNLPLRMLQYVADVYQKLLRNENLYGSRKILIPTPRFIVFYNGTKDQPERLEYRLSSSFQKETAQPELELVVTVLNINEGKNKELLSKCRTLQEYNIFVSKIRKNLTQMEPEEAMTKAVDECIQAGILRDFLLKNKAEVIAMSIYEFDEQAYIEAIRAEEREIAKQERLRADREKDRADQEKDRADQEKNRADQAEARAEQAENSMKTILINLISLCKKESLSKEETENRLRQVYKINETDLERLLEESWIDDKE